MKVNKEYLDSLVRDIFKPGACLVSTGRRGGGKSHCAVSYAQRLIEGYFPDMPKKVILVTNIIFVKKTGEDEYVTETPENVHHITSMKEYFPIVADALDCKDRKDVLILLVLDEAQNFLLGDLNSSGDLARSMKTFAGLLRKWNTVAWFLTPSARNLTPAFRNFIDADTDAGNVTCMFEKDQELAESYMRMRKTEGDWRDILFAYTGAHDRMKLMSIPTSSWTREPETLKVGEYSYDHLSSADFRVGEGFPFYDFIYAISGKSSYEMVSSIREFYKNMGKQEETVTPDSIRERYKEEIVCRMYCSEDPKITYAQIGAAFGVSEKSAKNWVKEYRKTHPELPFKN